MEANARYTLVGAAVVLLLALLAAAFVWVRSTGQGAAAQQYKIYFEHQSVQGLQPRGDVTMRGVKIGSIVSFRFAPQRPRAIEVFIAVDPNAPVRSDTRAVVDRNILTGLATLQLVGGKEASALLTEAPTGEPYPVIAEGESEQEHISQSLDQLVRHADEAFRDVTATLSPGNRAALEQSLRNVRDATRHADATLARADAALGAMQGASDEVRRLGRSLDDDARRLTDRYDALGAEATATVAQARETIGRVGDVVESAAQRADTAIATGGDEVRDAGRAVRSAADSVGGAAGRLRDPRQAVFGPVEGELGPGEGGR
jgi:phospholipid/cholesterol/gamma-HCH transport system substrate-binding protein